MNDTTVTDTIAVDKSPSKKSLAFAIFSAKLVERSQGLFALNRDFRSAVLGAIEAQVGVSRASASTMYNAAMKEAEAADPTTKLGRDPKKVKAASTGKRGRPVGSKNRATVAADEPVSNVVAAVAETAPVREEALM